METLQWIEQLAQRARQESVPALDVAAPRVQPVAYRLPRTALSLSAVGSLAAACLLLAMGLHAQRISNTTGSTSTRSSSDNMIVLFSPLKMGVN